MRCADRGSAAERSRGRRHQRRRQSQRNRCLPSLVALIAFGGNSALAFTEGPSLRYHSSNQPHSANLFRTNPMNPFGPASSTSIFPSQAPFSSQTTAKSISSTSLSSNVLGDAMLFFNRSNNFFLSRIVFLRALAFVYAMAFLIAKDQNYGLIGDNGISPARNVLNAAERRGRNARYTREQYMKKSDAGQRKKLPPPITFDDGGKEASTPADGFRIPNPISGLLNTGLMRGLGMAMNRNQFVQHWRERLWDRADALGRPVTTLLWMAPDRNNLNPWLDLVANCGLLLSMAVFAMGAANFPIMGALWLCQRSLMAVGGPFYGFGWEPQLAELGFHAMFLVPLSSLQALPPMAPPMIVIWMIRWHLFRIMIGAGLIKIRSGDPKWKMSNLSAMDYFYETQPIPNPLTRYMHWAPKAWHRFEVMTNHFVELIAPWLLLLSPVPFVRQLGGTIQLAFQSILIATGNLSFLNWLTCVPAILCFDDQFLSRLFPYRLRNTAALASAFVQPTQGRRFVSLTFGMLVATLSIPVVKNLLSKNQLMNASFDPLRLINTYGAFGTVEEERHELIISAASDIDGPWKEYAFRVKPGDVMKAPKFISPYHYRLDWQMWIASACQTLDRSPWMYTFLLKLLRQEPDVTALLENDPFAADFDGGAGIQTDGPKYIRVDKYRYRFHRKTSGGKGKQGETDASDDNNSEGSGEGKSSDTDVRGRAPYWDREHIRRVFPRQGVATELILEDIIGRTGSP